MLFNGVFVIKMEITVIQQSGSLVEEGFVNKSSAKYYCLYLLKTKRTHLGPKITFFNQLLSLIRTAAFDGSCSYPFAHGNTV
ncbi:hypothetical protein CYJ36_02055 [Bacillus sp. UMB0893]|nr:hypothetical protein CYJ36_02055 [Bacillus sp. UMB0893]